MCAEFHKRSAVICSPRSAGCTFGAHEFPNVYCACTWDSFLEDLTNFTGIQKFSEQHFIGFVLNAWGKPMVKS